MRRILLGLLAASIGASASGQFVLSRGGAEMVCADFLRDQDDTGSMASWIMGFWSGLNSATGLRVGFGTTTGNGVIGEVRLYCSQHPSDALDTATVKTYEKLRSEGK